MVTAADIVYYKKIKNGNYLAKLQQYISLEHAQNYIPIYSLHFKLNETNFNNICLNSNWTAHDLKLTKARGDGSDMDSYVVELKDKDGLKCKKPTFLKIAPLLDPIKYLLGKYAHTDSCALPDNLFGLPTYGTPEATATTCTKISNPNNASYIDSFFVFLSSQLLHKCGFKHGVDYYGSVLGIKHNFSVNIVEDLHYLAFSPFFNANSGKLFHVDDFSELMAILSKENAKLQVSQSKSNIPLEISFDNLESAAADVIDGIDNNVIEQCDSELEVCDVTVNASEQEWKLDEETTNVRTTRSSSSCSSRISYTDDEQTTVHTSSSGIKKAESKSELEDDDESTSSDDVSITSDMTINATFPVFPVQVTAMEKCECTLDSLILDKDVTEDGMIAYMMQYLMNSIAYYKTFRLTHNDMHGDNVMCIPTNQKMLYYRLGGKHYGVPTSSGRGEHFIVKIIDFGRAIYSFKGRIYCSDSFEKGGDAYMQYNTEPYYCNDKPRIDPNRSFDLCRLACSLFDYFVEEDDPIQVTGEETPFVRLLKEWCMDDSGKNLLYKSNGDERYPDFKLYKMIARTAHRQVPEEQLSRPEFARFEISAASIPKGAQIMNLDGLPDLA